MISHTQDQYHTAAQPALPGVFVVYCLCVVVLLLTFVLPSSAATMTADEAARAPALPPLVEWSGGSEALALPADSDHPWLTVAEATGFASSADYAATRTWFERLAASSPHAKLLSIGRSGEGRDIFMLAVSGRAAFDPAERNSDRPLVLIQAGIHPGEIDGKDAAMMLLRDLLFGGGETRHLLTAVELLVVPILNVDGHERASDFGRINQRGPQPTGWRTNARNLNLNRDYLKADSPEIRALLGVLNAWDPDLYLDIHVTDGMDHQYDLGWGGSFTLSPATGAFVRDTLRPAVDAALIEEGHLPGPLLFSRDEENPDAGLYLWSAAEPRFSDGYGNLRHLPTILVENHSLKPFRRRVLATRVFYEAVLRCVAREGRELHRAVAADRSRRVAEVPLAWELPEPESPRDFAFKGMAWTASRSPVSGGRRIEWLGIPVDKVIPLVEPTAPAVVVARPAAYWIPVAWTEVIERLALHGVAMQRQDRTRELEVEMYRVAEFSLAREPYEGRVRVELGAPLEVERRRERFPAGSVRVSTDQPLGELVMAMLEPTAPDSLFRWGFFLSILNRTEYVEPYIMEPMASRMLAADPELAAALQARREADPEFAADPDAILRWLYRHTPFCDPRWRVYPIGREVSSAADD